MRQSRRNFLKSVGASGAAFGAMSVRCSRSPRNPEPAKPNIVLVLADDLGYGDLSCYGQTRIRTPNLDRMAAEGMRFTQHYAGCTVCAPSRCALMTGMHTGHCSVRGNVDVLMKPEQVTVAEILKNAGYYNGCIGKWGIGHPPPPQDPQQNGFDCFFGYLSMWHAHNYYPDFLWRNGERVPLKNVVQHPEKHYKENQEELVGIASERAQYSHDLFVDEALSFIANQQRPFFLFLSLTIPHANNEAANYGTHGMEVPDYGDYANEDWPEPEKCKAAMISRMDRDIGRLMDKLRELGIEENSLLLFSSDNGPHREGGVDPEFFHSGGPLRGTKRDLYEGGIRVPLIARWPGKIRPGSESDLVCASWDFLPTFAELAGQASPADIDGLSLVPALLGKGEQRQHEFLYWEFHEGSSKQAIRFGDWKAVRLAPAKSLELYDLSQDIAEQQNVAENNPEIVAKASAILSTVRTDEQTWPLLNKAQGMPF